MSFLCRSPLKDTDKTQGSYEYTCTQPAVLSFLKHHIWFHNVLRDQQIHQWQVQMSCTTLSEDITELFAWIIYIPQKCRDERH